MITRKVDKREHLAGFIYNWVKEIASQVEELRVISWQEGDSSGLPANVKVIHLKTKQNRFLKVLIFLKTVKANLKGAQGVFCHQMPIYAILAAPVAKWRGKRVVSWYMHRRADWRLKLMEKLSDKVLSASAESFPLVSKKLIVTGHGIDLERFRPGEKAAHEFFQIISVGRISPTKDYESMIKAVGRLKSGGEKKLKLTVIGEAGLESQNIYFQSLKEMTAKLDLEKEVEFLGSRPNAEIPAYLQASDLFVNMSGTGSIDKAVLEAMACGCLVLTANAAFKNILPEQFLTERDQPELLAQKISAIIDLPEEIKKKYREDFIREVKANHDLAKLAKIIVGQFN